MSANADQIISEKEKMKKLKQVKKFTKQSTKEELVQIMQQKETCPIVQKEIINIMQKNLSMVKSLAKVRRESDEDNKNAIDETIEQKERELRMNHDQIILKTFLKTLNHPGHILMKYPSNSWAKPHTRKVCVKGIGNAQNIQKDAIFMWTKDKFCQISKITHVKAGKGNITQAPWKFCDEPDNLCFEIKIKKNILAFKCANHYGTIAKIKLQIEN